MRKKIKTYKPYIWIIAYIVFVIISFLIGFNPGKKIYSNFIQFLIEMIVFVPFVFIIIGLFDVWFPPERVEKYIGKDSGVKGVFFSILLGMLQGGPLYAAFPVAYILYKKRAGIKNIFIYLGAFSCLKIPLLAMEFGFLGVKFSIVHALVALPFFILIGYFMEWYLINKNFKVSEF